VHFDARCLQESFWADKSVIYLEPGYAECVDRTTAEALATAIKEALD
jgi:hypothetical protein